MKKCEQCQVQTARIQLRVHVNGQMQQVHLCETCYADIQNKMTSPSSSGLNPLNMHGFGSMFNGMMPGGEGGFGQSESDMDQFSQQQTQIGHGNGRGGLLDELGRNVTDAARAGLIDPVIGRDEEVKRVIEALNRRNKNNPVLIGEPGVGKTAIAEGLALKIIEGKVSAKLKDKQIYVLDVASLVANTGIRGQFEERMKQLINELKDRTDVILFIDEMHLIVGAGSAEGSMDAGNILKPALARGELQIIGATTLKEYRDIEKDAALERRLQPIHVHEPAVEDAYEILKGLVPRYEAHHEVQYTDEAIRACVTLSDRYVQDRYLPDKAIDLLDEAGSKMNLALVEEEDASLQTRLEQIQKEKAMATQHEQYERAAQLRDEELEILKQLEEQDRSAANVAQQSDQDTSSDQDTDIIADETRNEKVNQKGTITAADIQQIIEQKTGIPVSKLQQDEQQKLKNLDQRLADKVIGQEEAVAKTSKAIRRSRAGLKAKGRPIGSFLFVGPTGVGKTELAKSLAEELFGTKESMIRLDMSEYMEKHAVSKLIGSPPGYVGHEEAGQLTEKVRRNPYSIILLDEIEKAHPDVQHMFLQIMEDGRLTDSQGRTVSFAESIIIMTSNAGTANQKNAIGFGTDPSAIQEANMLDSLGDFFKPEFLNRFDGIIQFKHLEQQHLIQIVDLMLQEVQDHLTEQNLTLHVTEAAKDKLASMGYHSAFGARPLRRTIQEQIEDRIADLILDADHITTIHVDVDNGSNPIRVSAK